MEPAIRPRRSALYMPASNARAIEKARSLPCDVVILDLEDAVAPEAKPDARAAAVAAVKAGGFGRREVVIRVNGLGTPWGADDLAAGAATRLAALVMGVNDLAKEMKARQTPDRAAFAPFLATTVAAARAHGLVALDGGHNQIDDLGAPAPVCRQGAEFGFDGKSLIHPTHLAICNRAFAPPADEVIWAGAVVEAFARPENQGKGALRVTGCLAEHLRMAEARRLLALAAA